MQENEVKRMRLHMILFRVTAVILCATLVSCHMVSGLWARYATHADLGDSASVAVFRVDAARKEGESGNLTQHLTGDTTDDVTTYHIVITNTSEVAVNYSVRIVFDNDTAASFTAALDTGLSPTTASSSAKEWANVGTLAGGQTAVRTLTITASVTFEAAQMQSASSRSFEQTFDFDTFVTFEQAD